jgi:hypothetical protein
VSSVASLEEASRDKLEWAYQQQRRRLMTLYCGIDLHSNNSVISLIDETDRLVSERRLDNDLATIEQHLQPYQDEISGVVVESTYNW